MATSPTAAASSRRAWTSRALVVLQQDGALRVPDEALQELKMLRTSHVHVLGVLGPQHTGKRVLLRAMLHADKDADVEAMPGSPSASAGRMGGRVLLWMWREQKEKDCAMPKTPAEAKARRAEDEDATRIVLAANTTDVDDVHKRQCVALVLLLSSMLLYNDDGQVDEQALARSLAWLQEVAASLRIAPNQDEDAVLKDFKLHAPMMIWAVRNSKLKWLSSATGETMTAPEYLEQQLADEAGFNDAVTARNTARMYLRALFPTRDCIFLPRAVDADGDVVREQFATAVDKFYASRVSVKAAAQSQFPFKRILDRELLGQHFAVVLESYVKAINAGGLPTIQVASNAIHQTIVEEAFVFARDLYAKATVVGDAKKQEQQACASKSLWIAHLRGLQAATNHLMKIEPTLPTRMKAQFAEQRKTFEEDAEKQLQQACALNKQRSTDACRRVLKEVMPQGKVEALITSVESRRRQSFPDQMSSSMVEYKSDLQVAMEKYRMNAQGPEAFAVLEKSILASVRAFTSQWGPSILQRYQQHLRSIQVQQSQLEHELEIAKAQDTSSTFSAEDHKRLYEEQLASATQQLTELRRVLQNELNDKKSELERLMGELNLMDGKHQAQMKAVECDLAWVRSRSLELEKAAREERKRLEYDESGASMEMEAKERSFQEEEQALMAQHKKLMARVVELEAEVTEKKTAHIQQVFKVEAETSRRLNGLHQDHNEFVRQLKTQGKSDKGVLRLSFQKTKMAVQGQLERVERDIKELEEKLSSMEQPPPTPTPTVARTRSTAGLGKKSVSSRTSSGASGASGASTLSSRISGFQLFPNSPPQQVSSPRTRAATFAPSKSERHTDTDMCKTQ